MTATSNNENADSTNADGSRSGVESAVDAPDKALMAERWDGSLPLVSKELLVQSAQSKTYVFRAVYGIALYGIGLWCYSTWIVEELVKFGRGLDVLHRLMFLQIGITYGVVPLLASGAITSEKERGTLELLLLTKLTPKSIIAEKFVSQFLSIATLQLMAMPLMTMTYPMGGVDLSTLVYSMIEVLCAAAIIVAWAVFCSSWAYTTHGSILSYLSLAPFGIAIAFYGSPAGEMLLTLAFLYGCGFLMTLLIQGAYVMEERMELETMAKREKPVDSADVSLMQTSIRPKKNSANPIPKFDGRFIPIFFLPQLLLTTSQVLGQYAPQLAVCISTVIAAVIGLMLLMAIGPAVLQARVKQPGWQPRSDVMQAVETAILELNGVACRGVSLAGIARESQVDPFLERRPIAWRELQRDWLQPRVLLWAVVFVEFVLAMIVCWSRFTPSQSDVQGVWFVVEMLIWAATLTALTLQSAGLFPQERLRESLAVLLVTPMSASEIITQKLAGVHRLLFAWTIPLITIWMFRTLGLLPNISATATRIDDGIPMIRLALEFLAVFLFPQLVIGIGVLCGLCLKTPARAMLTASAIILFLVGVPWGFDWFQHEAWFWFVTPVAPRSRIEALDAQGLNLWIGVAGRAITTTLVAVLLRQLALRYSSRLLGRLESEPTKVISLREVRLFRKRDF